MFQKIILLITILSPLVVRATDLHVDFNTLVAGKPAYKLPEPGIITFYGGAALLPQKFDLSKGIKIKFEFRADKVQSNPYARLMEGKGFSIHFINRKGSKVKLLVQPPGEKKYQQTVAPVTPSAEKWHLLVATLEPANNFISLQVDNGEKSTLPWNFKTQNIRDVKIFLGGTQMENCKRAFSGSIRNLTISIPWKSLEIAEKRSEKKLTVNGKPIVYHRVCQNNNRHYAFPGITQLQDKSLAVVFREGDSHVDPFGRICISRSYDNGKNWTAPLVIFDTASDDRDPSIQLLSDGRVLLTCFSNCCWTMKSHEKQYGSYIKAFKQSGEIADASYYLFSSDGGKNWEPPINMATFTPHGPVFYQNHFFHPKVACLKQVEIRKISDDGQKNISLGKIKAPKDLPGKLFVEPHLAILPNGTMLCVIRVDFDGYVRLSRSEDGGRTWSKPKKLSLRGYPQHLLPLKDGRLLMTYGYRYYPYGIRGCISSDGGKTWDKKDEFIIRDGGYTADLGYPVSIEIADSKIMTVYYYNTDKIRQCFIEAAVYELPQKKI